MKKPMHKLMTLGYVRRDGKTLMLHRVKKENDMHEGKWNGLGGKLELGETPEECIIREILEETNGGIKVSNPKFRGRIVFKDLQGGPNNAHVYLFVIDDFEGEIIGESAEGDLEWVDDTELPNLNMWAGDQLFMQWLDEPGIFSAKLIYDGEKLVDHIKNVYCHK